MIRIENNLSQYNENVLSEDFTFENTLSWSLTSSGSGATMVSSTDKHYKGLKSLKITHPSYDLNDITFRPTTSTDYNFTVPYTGKYIFSLRALIEAPANLPEVYGGVSFYTNGGGSPSKTFSLAIGNNSMPEFSFEYNKWETYYEDVDLVQGDVISISIYIQNEATFTPGILIMFLDGFKLEYVEDKIYSLPTIYTKPI